MSDEDGDKQRLMAKIEDLERALRLIRGWAQTEKATADEKLSSIKTICDAALD